MRLGGKVALVTGASSGVGRAVALRLAAEGATVCMSGRDEGRLASTAGEVSAGGGRAAAFPADLTRDTEITRLRDRVNAEWGGVDIIVHCAGVIAFGSVEAAAAEEFDRQYRTNLRAPYLLTQALLPTLRERRGDVVFINSTAGLGSSPGSASYAATKHGLRALADSLRNEVNADGIRVLTVYLGRTATPMQEAVHANEGKPYRAERLIQPEDVGEVVVCAVGLPRTIEVTDIRARPAIPPCGA